MHCFNGLGLGIKEVFSATDVKGAHGVALFAGWAGSVGGELHAIMRH